MKVMPVRFLLVGSVKLIIIILVMIISNAGTPAEDWFCAGEGDEDDNEVDKGN